MSRFELSCPACGHLEVVRPHTRQPFACPECGATTLRNRASRFRPSPRTAAPPLVNGQAAPPARP